MAGANRVEPDFEEFYRRMFPPAKRLAYRILGDTGLAEDAAAEAFARAYAGWRKIRGLEYRDAWLLRVTTNVALDQARRKPAPVAAEEHVYFEDMVAVRLALYAALRTLPRRQRDTIALRYLAGLDDEQISLSLGISSSAVRTHVQRGLQRLRRRVGGDLGMEPFSDA